MLGGGSLAQERTPTGTAHVEDEDTVIELRQYTLRGGQRDTLITLFEQRFVEPQNAVGAHVIGTFRDLDDPDRFVWIRGFRDMNARPQALSAFYGGPVWLAHRAAANAMMVDSDNVLLLRPSEPGPLFAPQRAGIQGNGSIITATIFYLSGVEAAAFVRFFEQAILPRIEAAGAKSIAQLVSEEVPNNFSRLPIRERDRVFLWFARWPNIAAEEAFAARMSAVTGWRDAAPESVLPALMRKPERLRLAPTPRSALR